ncbi:MAG: hypothetical protein KBD52_02545 [Candidatus Pacebacteria bacterium]|nr:hypothetical protein [Candidatus Paceibacterota bacterium]
MTALHCLLILVAVFAAIIFTVHFKKMRNKSVQNTDEPKGDEEDKQKEKKEEGIPIDFGQSGGIKISGGMVILILIFFLPSLVSGQDVFKDYIFNPPYWRKFWDQYQYLLVLFLVVGTIGWFVFWVKATDTEKNNQ